MPPRSPSASPEPESEASDSDAASDSDPDYDTGASSAGDSSSDDASGSSATESDAETESEAEAGSEAAESSAAESSALAAKMGPHSWFWCPLCKSVYTGVTRMALAQRWYALVCARTEEDDERLEAARNLAICLCDDGQYVEAEKMQREILPVRKRVHGIKHATTLQACKALAGCLLLQAKHAEAADMYQEILEVRERVQGPEHAETLAAKEHLASSLCHQAKSTRKPRTCTRRYWRCASGCRASMSVAPGTRGTIWWRHLLCRESTPRRRFCCVICSRLARSRLARTTRRLYKCGTKCATT